MGTRSPLRLDLADLARRSAPIVEFLRRAIAVGAFLQKHLWMQLNFYRGLRNEIESSWKR